ncbi:MAG: multicopper oxidase domain-containing protein [Proteobacteria bacterium]|nr:multicopper oxidase domain-containing protein [Pseudomonadota bacterium]
MKLEIRATRNGAHREMEADFSADHPGSTLLDCHMQIHMDMDCGFMALFDRV